MNMMPALGLTGCRRVREAGRDDADSDTSEFRRGT